MMRDKDDPANEPRRLRERIEKLERAVTGIVEADFVVEMPRRLKLRAPNGRYYILSVTDTGALVTADAGTQL